MNIRQARLGDEEALLCLFQSLDQETDFMLFEPGERKTTASAQAEILKNISKLDNISIWVVECDESFVGFLGATGGGNHRNRHVMNFVVGVKQAYWHRGIGKSLMSAMEVWALDNGYHRLEMTVREQNKRAIALYESLGFSVEGVRQHSLKVGGEYVNEFYMAKLI